MMNNIPVKSRSLKNHLITAITLAALLVFILSCTMLPMCDRNGERIISGEKLSQSVKSIDDEVKVSRKRVDEFESLNNSDFETITPFEILKLVAFDYQYSYNEGGDSNSSIISADFVDGRKVMIVRFFQPGKIESFYLQFQSNLYEQGYYFGDRLKYDDLCNYFVSEDESTEAYLLKKDNYFIMLMK